MMIEDTLLNYGVLGAWTLTLLYRQFTFENKLSKIIDRNTEALINVNATISKCTKGGKK